MFLSRCRHLWRVVSLGMMCGVALGGCAYGLGTGSVIKGSGTLKTETIPVKGFNAVLLSGVGQLVIQQTGTESLTISAEDNLLPLIDVSVQGTTLTIRNQSGTTLQPTQPLQYLLTVKDLNSIGLSGAGGVTITQFKTATLAVTLKGVGNAALNGLTISDLSVAMSGTGSVVMGGQTQHQVVTCSGVGVYNAANLASHTATIQLSGTGNATVRVSDSLDVTITGVGSLTYLGNPTVTKHITGVGKVHQG